MSESLGADIFLICPRFFVQTFLEILTQNSQFSKHAFLPGNCHKSSQTSSRNAYFEDFTFDHFSGDPAEQEVV